MNASLINSKQVENDITKTLRDFFSQVTETPTSKEFSIKSECTNSFLKRLYMNLLVIGLGLRIITTKMSRKPIVFSNPNLK